MTTVYLEAYSGVAGDMMLGALVDLGVPLAAIEEPLRTLPLDGWSLAAKSVERAGLHATKVEVEVPDKGPGRTLAEIEAILAGGQLAESARDRALLVFRRLFAAEAVAHGKPIAEVHLHEAGAVDAVVDITGTVLGLAALGVERFLSSPLPLGGGSVRCEHGLLPVPGPAVVELTRGIPVYGGPLETELTTPTGAALVATLSQGYGPLPRMRLARVGVGAGTYNPPERANVLRLFLGHETDGIHAARETVVALEANLDDLSPQVLGHVVERLLEAGALDATLAPVTMKKGRPGVVLSVLAPLALAEKLENLIFAETTTLGVRRHEARRTVLARRTEIVETAYGAVGMKVATVAGTIRDAAPEYEDCRRLAMAAGVALRVVQSAAVRAWEDKLRRESR